MITVPSEAQHLIQEGKPLRVLIEFSLEKPQCGLHFVVPQGEGSMYEVSKNSFALSLRIFSLTCTGYEFEVVIINLFCLFYRGSYNFVSELYFSQLCITRKICFFYVPEPHRAHMLSYSNSEVLHIILLHSVIYI